MVQCFDVPPGHVLPRCLRGAVRCLPLTEARGSRLAKSASPTLRNSGMLHAMVFVGAHAALVVAIMLLA
jgi:hypothetical protein